MGKGTSHTAADILLIKGPVNTALYDLRSGEVFTINPLMATLLEGDPDKNQPAGARHAVPLLGGDVDGAQSRRPPVIGREALKVLRGYLTRHPALTLLMEERNSKGFSNEAAQTLFYPSGPVRLDFMWLELTESCNLFCTHCYSEAGTNHPNPLPSREGESISLGQWKDILSEGARLGAKKIIFTGGEPTLHPGLTDLIEHARYCRYDYIEVFTNATRLEDSLLRQWAASGIKVALSFYSHDPETHDKITGSPGSFQQTVQGIKAILSHKIPVRVGIVLMRDNLAHHKETIEFLKGLGLKDGEIGWDYVRPTGRGVAETALMGEDMWKEVTPFEPSSSFEQGQATCGDKKFAQGTCWKGRIMISSEGVVYPCCFGRELPMGRFPETGLEEIIRGRELQRLWQINLDEVETCRDCELRYTCFDCRALAQTTTGNLFTKNPRCRYNPYTGLMENNGALRMEKRPKRRADVINEVVEDEMVLYDPKSHNVHHLNPVAGVIWELCDGNHTTKDIAEEIVGALKADPSQVKGDVTKTIKDFRGKGLLEKVSK